MTRISVDLPDALAASLRQMSETRGVALDEVVAEALALMADLLPDMERRVEEGRADIEAGRFVEHERVAAWLRSWGTENELPPPKCD